MIFASGSGVEAAAMLAQFGRNTAMTTLGRLSLALALVQLTACGQVRLSKAPPPFSETILGTYRKDLSGGFSPYWVAYIIDPEKGEADQSSFVELNGKRLGPYAQVSGMIEISRNGKHIAFAAKKGEKWVGAKAAAVTPAK